MQNVCSSILKRKPIQPKKKKKTAEIVQKNNISSKGNTNGVECCLAFYGRSSHRWPRSHRPNIQNYSAWHGLCEKYNKKSALAKNKQQQQQQEKSNNLNASVITHMERGLWYAGHILSVVCQSNFCPRF